MMDELTRKFTEAGAALVEAVPADAVEKAKKLAEEESNVDGGKEK